MTLNVELDMKLFIDEVRNRPAIWDSDSLDYVNKPLKNRCWDEVCFATYPGYEKENEEQKAEISKLLRRRWRSLRDSYSRELNASKTRKSSAIREKKKTYVYFDQLHFIRTSVEKRTVRYLGEEQGKDNSNHDSEEPCDDLLAVLPVDMDCQIDESYCLEGFEEKFQPQVSMLVDSRKRTAGGREFQDLESQGEPKRFATAPGLSITSQSTSNLNDDEDRMFLLSLLGDFKKVHQSHRLDLKSDIISAIRTWQKAPVK